METNIEPINSNLLKALFEDTSKTVSRVSSIYDSADIRTEKGKTLARKLMEVQRAQIDYEVLKARAFAPLAVLGNQAATLAVSQSFDRITGIRRDALRMKILPNLDPEAAKLELGNMLMSYTTQQNFIGKIPELTTAMANVASFSDNADIGKVNAILAMTQSITNQQAAIGEAIQAQGGKGNPEQMKQLTSGLADLVSQTKRLMDEANGLLGIHGDPGPDTGQGEPTQTIDIGGISLGRKEQ
jgi:hypothetical protein